MNPKAMALCVALVLSLPVRQLAQAPPKVTLVKAAHLLDPRTGNVLSPAAVLIQGGKIEQVGAPAQLEANAPKGVQTTDLGSARLGPQQLEKGDKT